MAYILHLETATKACSVALSLNGSLKQFKESTEEHFSHGENLTLYIQEVLEQELIDASHLNAISLSSGPGSYTGLRIGVSVAKGMCYALNIPLIAIDSLQCIYELAKEEYPDFTVIPMIDARRMEVFSTVFDQNGKRLKEVSADIINTDSYLEFGKFVACGDGAAKLREIWNGRDLVIDSNILSSARGQVVIAFQKFLRQEFENLAYFEPFYLKDFVAGVKSGH